MPIARQLKRANFSLRRHVGALLFLQIGFATISCHHDRSMIAFVYRTKTSIHFSRFSRLGRDSIVSVALSLPGTSRIGGWALPTIIFLGVRTFLPSECVGGAIVCIRKDAHSVAIFYLFVKGRNRLTNWSFSDRVHHI